MSLIGVQILNLIKFLRLIWEIALLVATGQPIGVIGYAYGTDLLSSEGDIVFDRFGPIFQQGYISAVAPIDDISDPDKFLLDNCAGA